MNPIPWRVKNFLSERIPLLLLIAGHTGRRRISAAISDYAIQRLRGEGIEMYCGMLSSIAPPDASFEAVISSQVLKHIVHGRGFLGRRAGAQAGRALIFVPGD